MLMAHLYYGDPNKEFSDKLAETLLVSGADVLEVGIPYTDPVCDGEIFQRACKRALKNGIIPLDVFDGIKRSREKGYKQPIYLTSYYAPIYKMGVAKFVRRAKEADVSGLIVPDLLLEEQRELQKACRKDELSVIQFATVYSSKERLKRIIEVSTTFIYCVSLPGVTGEIGKVTQLRQLLQLLKQLTEKPVYVGFGIKSEEDVKNILEMGADGVIVGSAIAQIYEKHIDDPKKSLGEIGSFVKKLKESTI